MDWKTIGNYALLISLFVTMVVMFNQINDRMDRMQAETNARFDGVNGRFDRMQAETNARFDRLQAETSARFDAINARFDAAEVANSRQHDDLNRRFDEMFEVLRAFEGRISRLEGRMDEQSGVGAAE